MAKVVLIVDSVVFGDEPDSPVVIVTDKENEDLVQCVIADYFDTARVPRSDLLIEALQNTKVSPPVDVYSDSMVCVIPLHEF